LSTTIIRDEACIDHLQQVLVLEIPRDFPDDGRRLTVRLQALIQRDQALVVLAVLAGEDVFPSQVVDRGNRRRTG
jgi:hypothetical protein